MPPGQPVAGVWRSLIEQVKCREEHQELAQTELEKTPCRNSIIHSMAAIVGFWPAHEDLSSIKNLATQYNVKIRRDTYGVAHILGHTDKDSAYGLAYAQSEDDFLTIQQVLLAPRGYTQANSRAI